MKRCTRLATLLYRVVSCCILLYKVWSLSNFFTKTNVVRYKISFVLQDVVWYCTRLATPCNFNFVVLCSTRAWAVEAILSPGQTSTTFHTTSYNFDVAWNVALVWPSCCIVLYRVVSCCVKFDRDKTFHWTNVVRYNISFVFRDVVWCSTRLATPCNFVVLCSTRAWAVKAIFPLHSFVDWALGN